MGERRRLQLTHGMRVGEQKGIEHGEKWVRWIRQEKEAMQWGVEGGEARHMRVGGNGMLASKL
jgi:hypothetical protein